MIRSAEVKVEPIVIENVSLAVDVEVALFLVVLDSEDRVLGLLTVDEGLFEGACVLVGTEDFVVDFEGDGGVVEDEVLGHDGEYAVDSLEFVLFGLLSFVEVGAFLAVNGVVDAYFGGRVEGKNCALAEIVLVLKDFFS